jgi:hypothetical protein
MNAKPLLLILISLIHALAVFAAEPPVFFLRGNLSDVQALSRVEQRPLMIYVAAEGDPEGRRMQSTWSNKPLQHWLKDHYLAYFQAVAPDSIQALRFPNYVINTTPTVLIYHPHGWLMGSVEGFVAPQTLRQILQNHYDKLQPMERDVPLPFRRKPTAPLMIQMPVRQSVDLQVQGLEAYSLSQLSASDGAAPTLGLRIGDYHSYRKICREIRRMEKVWPGEMWVYAQGGEHGQAPSEHEPVYTLVLGTFDNLATAHRYADAIYRYTSSEADILDLGGLLQEP